MAELPKMKAEVVVVNLRSGPLILAGTRRLSFVTIPKGPTLENYYRSNT